MHAASEVFVTLSTDLLRHMCKLAQTLDVPIQWIVAGLVCDTIETNSERSTNAVLGLCNGWLTDERIKRVSNLHSNHVMLRHRVCEKDLLTDTPWKTCERATGFDNSQNTVTEVTRLDRPISLASVPGLLYRPIRRGNLDHRDDTGTEGLGLAWAAPPR